MNENESGVWRAIEVEAVLIAEQTPRIGRKCSPRDERVIEVAWTDVESPWTRNCSKWVV